MEPTKKLRILVFDDDPAISILLKKLLTNMGHDVRTYPDPTACPTYKNPHCECSQEHPCADVILSDFMMPNMNGIEFFEHQRKRGCKALDANKAIISAAASPEQQAAFKRLGCHYIKKPFRIAQIQDWLAECAQRVMGGRELAEVGS